MKQLTVSLLLASLLCASLASCGGDDPAATVDTKGDTTPVTEAVTEAVRVTADLPAKDFGGEEFTFYGRIYDGVWSATDIFSHEEDGEQINDAVYARTAYIEDTYNVKLAALESGESTVVTYLKNFITAGDDTFEAIVCDVYDSGALAVDGMLYDLNNVQNLDLSREWWAQSTNNSLSIAEKQFYVTGDIFINDNKSTRIFFFNKDIIRDLDLENPYDLVDDNKWTIDKYIELSESALYDLNGDNTYTRDADRYGTMAQTTLGSVLYFASGNLLTGKDEKALASFGK